MAYPTKKLDTKNIFGALGAINLLVALILTILGIVIIISSSGSPNDDVLSDDLCLVDNLVLQGTFLIFGGILGIVAGGLSVGCGIRENKNGISAAAVFFTLASTSMIVALFLLLDPWDGEYSVNAGATFPSGSQCGGDYGDACWRWACDVAMKKEIATVFGVIGSISTIVTAILGCGAACCCSDQFEPQLQLPPVMPPGQATVVGQPA